MRRARRVVAAFLLAAPGLGAQGMRGGAPQPEIVSSAVLDTSKDINFASGVWPRRLYVGQQATYQIGIFLGEDMRSRLRSNPQFVPPDVRSMIAIDLPVSTSLYTRRAGARTYDVHVFSRALFPLAAGTQTVPPARLTYAVPLSNSIFSREESHSARSTAHALTVLEPPVATRPGGFAGAVGRLSVRAKVDASDTRVGDPVLLTLVVSGVGNVGLFPRPPLVVPWGHVVAGTERVRVDTTAPLVSGDKVFEWVLTPREPGAQTIPAIRYPYFDPYTERYEVAVTTAVNMRIRPGTLATPSAPAGGGSPRASLRRTFRGDVGEPWPARAPVWIGLLLAPLPALVLRWRRREPAVTGRSTKASLDALARQPRDDAREIRRLARQALTSRLGAESLVDVADGAKLERALRRAGVTVGTARDARRLIEVLDEYAYAGTTVPGDGLAAQAHAVLSAVDQEAAPANSSVVRTPWRATLSLVLCGVALHGLGATATDRDADAFEAGLQAYDNGDVGLARQTFSELAMRRQRAPDVWANLGTAAWQASDTAGAVIGWQRALRLEPLASDVRDRLRMTPSFREGMAGDIPPVPVNAVAALGMALWLLGWGRGLRRRSGAVLPFAVAAGLFGLGALGLSERQRGHREVVVVAAETLREAPAMSGRTGAAVFVGETGSVLTEQGVWSRVRFHDDRQGWIESRGLQSLELPPAR